MNKQLTTSLLISSLSLSATAAQAQATFAIGPEVGLVSATSSFKKYGTPFNTTYRAGLEAGVQACIPLGHHIALQPTLLYSQFGFGIDNTRSFTPGVNSTIYQVNEHYRFNYLTLTPQLVYHIQPTGQGWQVFGAPYGAFLLGGNYSADDQHEWASGAGLVQVSDGRIERGGRNGGSYGYNTTYYMPSFDAGLKVGLGYRFNSVLLQASYSLGLINLGSDYDSVLQRTDYYNRAIHFSLAYLFSSKS